MTEIWKNKLTGEVLVGEMLEIGHVAGGFVEYEKGKEQGRIHIEYIKEYERIF